ncbi:hypothetical protein PO883_15010 [Massilia sp. DJPM01]|uniref:hypothetical protein n=1 Tax=Massilia sp. DJPM01 TaxID=3024404 RepID=UPI00259FCBE5|nr:hypothetical protein [Massilia sp. DJPM01]MDM5178506.1 hypothetical protein [Massilia sp. DJPM01]
MARIIPPEISAGLTFSALASLENYLAPEWSLSLALRGPASIDLVSVPESTGHRLDAAASATAAYLPGLYRYTLRATRSGIVREVENGTVNVLADVAALPAGGDMRTHACIVLDNINAVIEKRATQDQQKYTINNRELWRTPLKDLLLLRATYIALVRAEEASARGSNCFGQTIRMRLA